jgi:hypothetical protein
VDKSSIEVLETTEEQFTRPAVDAVSRAQFRPALLSGNPVRQLAEESIRFVIRY